MKTKWKIITLLVIFVLFTNTITFAGASKYYADLLLAQKDQMEKQLSERYTNKYQEQGQINHRDMVTQVEAERVALMERLNLYMDKRIKNESNERMEKHYEELNKAVEQLEKELKEYIDSLE